MPRSSARLMAVIALALLNVLVIAAGAVLAAQLPARLALWKIPVVASRPLIRPAALLDGPGGGRRPTRAGLSARLSGLLATPALGSHVTAVVGDPASGQVLFSRQGGSPATPASTAKLATAVAALDVLGPGARLHHPRRRGHRGRAGRGARAGPDHPRGRGRPDAGGGPGPGQRVPAPGHAGRPGRGHRPRAG